MRLLTEDDLLTGRVDIGCPLRISGTGERVYFRAARVSPPSVVLVVVAGNAGGRLTVLAGDLRCESVWVGTP